MLTLGSVEPGDPKIIEDELPDWWGGLPPFPQIKYQHPQNRLVLPVVKRFTPVKMQISTSGVGGRWNCTSTAEKLIKVLLGIDEAGYQ